MASAGGPSSIESFGSDRLDARGGPDFGERTLELDSSRLVALGRNLQGKLLEQVPRLAERNVQAYFEAAKKLVTTHLRLVAKIAVEYRSAYHNTLDLIQEGTVGLLQAVKHFDPDKGARLATYAQWWIRSYILKFILDNFRLIKIGTTKAQKKLFYNLMREKQRIEAMGYYATPEVLSKQLDVPEEVMRMPRSSRQF